MDTKNYLTPQEVLDATIASGEKKARLPIWQMLLLAILAGAFIAFAAEGSNMAAYGLLAEPKTYGLGRVVSGAVFGAGLMMVVLAGGELFTGNSLMVAAALEKKIKVRGLLKNWLIVYLGNLLGGILIAWLMSQTGLLTSGANELGAMTIKIAAGKTSLAFWPALVMGILCNWLVCLAVWMQTAAKDVAGKILAMFFPIWLFVISGFEHSVANMYYIPAGIFAKANPNLLEAARTLGVSEQLLANLNWENFFAVNLLPVTVGNILGGGVFVAGIYWLLYRKR